VRDLIRRLGRPAPVALAIAHVALLILVRAVRDADDVSQWDLISFLNAQCDSLGAVLRRPEVHFLNPFSFPIYNVGAESAVSTVLHKGFGYLSLHWSTLLVLLVYDAVFLYVVDGLFRLVLEDERARAWGWLLLSMSWVTLTFASTQAFTMQAYWVIVLALSGVEWFAHGRDGRGTLCLAVAFLFMSQGYALSFLIPYYTVAWALFVLGWECYGIEVRVGAIARETTRNRVDIRRDCALAFGATREPWHESQVLASAGGGFRRDPRGGREPPGTRSFPREGVPPLASRALLQGRAHR